MRYAALAQGERRIQAVGGTPPPHGNAVPAGCRGVFTVLSSDRGCYEGMLSTQERVRQC